VGFEYGFLNVCRGLINVVVSLGVGMTVGKPKWDWCVCVFVVEMYVLCSCCCMNWLVCGRVWEWGTS
jgi:hypothetical protein